MSFQLVLKQITVLAFLISSGREFHNFGAIKEKALPPWFSVSAFWGQSSESDADLKVRDGWYISIKGFRPCIVLYVMTRILNSILFSTGRQCKFFSIGVTWSDRLRPITRRPAVFWIRWSLCLWYLGIPYKRQWQ